MKILLIDDHQMFMDGIKAILSKKSDHEVCGQCNDGASGLKFIQNNRVDLVLLDVNMPKMNGIELTKNIRSTSSATKIIGLSMNEDLATVKAILEVGANGYLFKNLSEDELFNAIEQVAKGNNYINPQLLDMLINLDNKSNQASEILTKREVQIIKLIANGLQNSEIAEQLNISLFTVKSHRKNILRKLDLRNTAGLVRYVYEHKML